MGRPGMMACVAAAVFWTSAMTGAAQESGVSGTAGATDAAAVDPAEGLLSAAELQKLVAPVALYPDTVLIQVLIGASAPLDVVKADRLLRDNPGTPADALEQEIKAAAFDPSVEVLAIAFPQIIREMAVHIDWTDAAGTAMLAQSDDVLDAVQVMRAQAINSGALVSSPEVTVSTDPQTSAVVVQPASPEIVYVPQYDPQVVYAPPAGTALATGMVVFGTVALISEIFDDDDDWHGYWGCRNCGGWGGAPIIRNPDIDIDVDGDVNIGNRVDIDGGWKPDNTRVIAARDQISIRRGGDGQGVPGLDRPASRADELRAQLGAPADLRERGVAGDRAQIDRGTRLGDRTPAAARVNAPKVKARPAAPPVARATPQASNAGPKIARNTSAQRTRDASQRGALATRGGGRRR